MTLSTRASSERCSPCIVVDARVCEPAVQLPARLPHRRGYHSAPPQPHLSSTFVSLPPPSNCCGPRAKIEVDSERENSQPFRKRAQVPRVSALVARRARRPGAGKLAMNNGPGLVSAVNGQRKVDVATRTARC